MTETNRKFVVLGGDGVFGIHMVKALLVEESTDVVVSIGRNQRKPPPYTLGVGQEDARFTYVQMHMTHETDLLVSLLDDIRPSVVINFAALAYATSWTQAWRYFDSNVVGLARVVEHLAKQSYLEHFVQIGSSEVYGSSSQAPARESDKPRPSSPYAVSKLAGDLLLQTFHTQLNFPCTILRPSNCYGPGQQPYRLIPRAAIAALTGGKFPLQGGGRARKSFMHADDLAAAVCALLQLQPAGEIYNAGPPDAISMRQIVEIVAAISNRSLNEFVSEVAERQGEDGQYWLDSSKLRSETGWRPRKSLEAGVAEVVEWVASNLAFLESQSQEYVFRS